MMDREHIGEVARVRQCRENEGSGVTECRS